MFLVEYKYHKYLSQVSPNGMIAIVVQLWNSGSLVEGKKANYESHTNGRVVYLFLRNSGSIYITYLIEGLFPDIKTGIETSQSGLAWAKKEQSCIDRYLKLNQGIAHG